MRGLLVAALIGVAGCAPALFHGGRTALARGERPYLAPRPGAPGGIFARFWSSPNSRPWGLLRWNGNQSFAVRQAPLDLLQSVRDEVGRLNQVGRTGEDLSVAVTVYRFDRAGWWNPSTAYYELVARDMHGQVVWAADDKIDARPELAQSLADPPSAIIAREILRKLRQQLRL